MGKNDQLRKIERSLEEKGQRGHVYLPPAGAPMLTTVQKDHGQQSRSEIIGPQPARDAIRAAIGKHESLQRWTEELRTKTTVDGLVPPVVWNSVHLVVTGVTATHALLIALHHPNEYDEAELKTLSAGVRSKSCDLDEAFAQATGGTLPAPARQWLRQRNATKEQSQATRESEARAASPHQEGETILTKLADRIRTRPDEPGTLRIMMRGIARTWQNIDRSERERILKVPPRLSGTKWDALLAAVVEHIAWLSGYSRPQWVDEQARFNDPPQNYARIRKGDAVCWSPGAFLRHGALADPRDLDGRGGEHGYWIPQAKRGNRRADDHRTA